MGLVELGYASTEAVTPVAIRAMQEAMIPAPPAGPLPSILEQPWQMILQPDFQVLAWARSRCGYWPGWNRYCAPGED